MTTQTLTLAGFLTARLDEDKAAAEQSLSAYAEMDPSDVEQLLDESDKMMIAMAQGFAARVLAEVAAKRRIVRAFEAAEISRGVDYELGFGLDLAVRILASVYADHADYQAEWSG